MSSQFPINDPHTPAFIPNFSTPDNLDRTKVLFSNETKKKTRAQIAKYPD